MLCFQVSMPHILMDNYVEFQLLSEVRSQWDLFICKSEIMKVHSV